MVISQPYQCMQALVNSLWSLLSKNPILEQLFISIKILMGYLSHQMMHFQSINSALLVARPYKSCTSKESVLLWFAQAVHRAKHGQFARAFAHKSIDWDSPSSSLSDDRVDTAASTCLFYFIKRWFSDSFDAGICSGKYPAHTPVSWASVCTDTRTIGWLLKPLRIQPSSSTNSALTEPR